jgi:tetratricopeptide (TPR) repeat protein
MLGLIYLALNQSSEAIAYLEKAIAVYEQLNQGKEFIATALEYLDNLYQQTEDFEKLIAILEKRLTRLQESQDRSGEYSFLYRLGNLYYQLKKYSPAWDYYNSALQVAQKLTERQLGNEANAYFMLGLMCHNLEKLEDAVVNYREALKLYTELGGKFMKGWELKKEDIEEKEDKIFVKIKNSNKLAALGWKPEVDFKMGLSRLIHNKN